MIGPTAPCDLTASELGTKLRAGEISAVEILDSCRSRIDAVDDRVHAVASYGGTYVSSIFEPHVVRMPLLVSTSLSASGMPATALCGAPVAR